MPAGEPGTGVEFIGMPCGDPGTGVDGMGATGVVGVAEYCEKLGFWFAGGVAVGVVVTGTEGDVLAGVVAEGVLPSAGSATGAGFAIIM